MLNHSILWTTEDVAAFLQVSVRQVTYWREKSEGPDYLSLAPRVVRYSPREVVRWASEHRTTTKHTAAPTGTKS